jgi:hypothetical protein
MRLGGANSATLTGNARPGLILAWTVIRSPGAMWPSILSTVLFQEGYRAASVRRAQMRSGVERIEMAALKAFIVWPILLSVHHDVNAPDCS